MPVLHESCSGAGSSGGGVDDSDRRQRCSCLPFCFFLGGVLSGKQRSAGAPTEKGRRRRRRFRLRLSWLAWPWCFRKQGAGGEGKKNKGKKQRRGRRRLLLLLTTSMQPKKALASVVSGDSALLPAKVISFGDAKKQNNRKPRPTVDDGPSGSRRQPHASTTAATASTRWTSAAPARSARTATSQPSPRPTEGPAAAGRIWRAPSRRHSFHYQSTDSTERPAGGAGGLWTAATTLGVIVLFGRVTAVVFLCSCLYGARFVRARVGGASASGSAKAKAKSSGVAGGSISSSRRFGGPVGVAAERVVAEHECKKKVVIAGLLDTGQPRCPRGALVGDRKPKSL